MNHGRDVDMNHLHPVFRERLQAVLDQCAAESLPFKPFECYRSPARQQYLYEQGRSRPGRKVTNAQAWESMHQYGMAVDLVPFIDGKWSWPDTPEFLPIWQRMQAIGEAHGLRHLSWERPHLELPLSLESVRGGLSLDVDDDLYHEVMEAAAASWPTGAPPLVAMRPPLEFA